MTQGFIAHYPYMNVDWCLRACVCRCACSFTISPKFVYLVWWKHRLDRPSLSQLPHARCSSGNLTKFTSFGILHCDYDRILGLAIRMACYLRCKGVVAIHDCKRRLHISIDTDNPRSVLGVKRRRM